MRQTIIILIVLLNYTHNLFAQSQPDVELLQLEQEVYMAKTDSERAPLLLKKVDLYIKDKDFSKDALKEARRIDYTLLPNEELKTHFLWNAALLANLNGDLDYAGFYIDRYHTLYNDTSMQYALVAILINNGQDSALLTKSVKNLAVRDANVTCLTCLNEVAYYEKKGRNGYLISSVIVPGLGIILEGYPLKGTASLLVNAASALAVYELIRSNLYINAVCWGLTLASKFYIGNIRLTDKLFTDKELKQKNALANTCKSRISVLLKTYPILFK
jgi:hypothetical protein